MPLPRDHGSAAQQPVAIGAHVLDLALAANGQAPAWIHLIPAGSFTFRDGRGPYRLEDGQAVVAASRQGALGGRLPVDYDHAIDYAAPRGVASPAAGWLVELEARPDGVWGRVEWTARAAQAVAAKEWLYISPVFEHTAGGAVVRVLRASLTNNPAIPNLMALASARPQQQEPDMDLAPLRTTLGAANDADAEALVATATAARTALARVAAAVGLAADAKGEEIAAKVEAAVKAADPARFVPLEVVTGLQTELATLRQDQAAGKAAAAVEAAMKAGKLMPCLKDWGMALATDNPTAFAAWAAATPVLASGERLVGGGRPPAAAPSNPVEIAAAANALRAQAARDGRELDHVTAVHRVIDAR